MKPQGGFVIGDGTQLSAAVSHDLLSATRNGENVVRVAAPSSVPTVDRPAEVARHVAELMRPLPGVSPEVVIANPGTPEAVSASALAAALKLPILFVDNRAPDPTAQMNPPLPDPTSQAIASLGVKKALIVGGTGAVDSAVQATLSTMLGVGNVKRVGGADVNATSDAVFSEAKTRGLPVNVVYVADGARPIDGALLGAAVGRLNGGMLLTSSASTVTAETRLGGLGADAAVDRLVGVRGTGGSDPTVPVGPPPPVVSRFGLTNNPFVVGGGKTPRSGTAARARRHRRGTTFTYTLSGAASARFVIAERLAGRRHGGRCVAPTRRLRHARRCTRIIAAGTLMRISHRGANRVAFSGRIGSRALSPGSYQVTLIATDAGRRSSKARTILFTIVRR